jgi:hypothetical protein
MATEITHDGGRQIVSPEHLRRILRAHGERCYCPPDRRVEWHVAGRCPTHGVMRPQVSAAGVY